MVSATLRNTHKVHSRSFKINSGYFNRLNWLNEGGFPGVEFLRSTPKLKNRRKILSSSVFTSSIISHTGKFHVVFVQCRRKNVKKSVMHLKSFFLAIGAFILDLFPKAPLGEMAGFGFNLGFDSFMFAVTQG